MRNLQRELEIIQAYAAGEALEDILARFDISYTALYGALDRNGIPRGRKPGRRRGPPEREQQIVAAYQSGMTLAEISSRFEVSQATVYAMVRRAGGKVERANGRRKALTTGEVLAIRDAAAIGRSQAGIAKEFGISQQLVSQIARHVAYVDVGKSPKEKSAEEFIKAWTEALEAQKTALKS